MPLTSGPKKNQHGTMFTSIGSQESLDTVELDCGHGWSPEPSIFCQHCSSRLCPNCYPSHNKHFHGGGGGEIHQGDTRIQKVKTQRSGRNKNNTRSKQNFETNKSNTNVTKAKQTNFYPSSSKSNSSKTKTPRKNTSDITTAKDDLEIVEFDSDLEFDEFHFKTESNTCEHKPMYHKDKTKSNTCISQGQVSWDSGIDLPSQENEDVEENMKDIPNGPRTKHAFHIADIQCDDIKQPTRITGMVLTNRRLIVTDYLNKRVISIKTKNLKTNAQYDCSSGPWDLTEVSKGQVAVTLTDEQKITFLRLNKDELTLEREVVVHGFCDGIAYHTNKLVVSCINPAKLLILDLHGNQLCCLDNQSGGLFLEPRHVAFSPDGQRLFVSDFQRHAITCITLDYRSAENMSNSQDPDETAPTGAVSSESTLFAIENQYANSEMQGPEKIAVDGNGNVFVCCGNSNNIHLISAQCELLSVILTKADGLKYPQSLFCCPVTNRLFVGFDGDVGIKVFQLHQDDKGRDRHSKHC